MPYNCIGFEKDGPVAVATLNRPDVFNAVSGELLDELVDALDKCGKDDAIRAIILTGSGEKAFCSGGDVKGMHASLAGEPLDFFRFTLPRLNAVITAIRGLGKPVIAAVNGVAAGAGMNLALACDLRIAAEKARFIQSYVNVGLCADGGGSYFLPRLIGLARATELLFLGETLDARQAEALGLVTRVVPDSELMSAARELAIKLAAKPTFAIGRTKALLNLSFNQNLQAQLESESQNILTCVRTADFREGATAFAEKRQAKFLGK